MCDDHLESPKGICSYSNYDYSCKEEEDERILISNFYKITAHPYSSPNEAKGWRNYCTR